MTIRNYSLGHYNLVRQIAATEREHKAGLFCRFCP